MSAYVQATNFTAKDALATGTPAKTIKGSEFDAEFILIAAAIASKLDLTGGTISGTLTLNGTVDGTGLVDGGAY